ncbi:MAG: DinB family protein [Ferruginibacter sp.]
MNAVANELEKIVDDYAKRLAEVDERVYVLKPLPHKWSKKEVLGHLIDSAQNNIRRFVVAQYEDKPHIVYAQDNWVTAANYQQYSTTALIELWGLLNRHMAIILKSMPAGAEGKLCLTGELCSIEWLAVDYIKHLKHHLHQILELEPIAYP